MIIKEVTFQKSFEADLLEAIKTDRNGVKSIVDVSAVMHRYFGPRNLNKHSPNPASFFKKWGSFVSIKSGDAFLLASDVFWHHNVLYKHGHYADNYAPISLKSYLPDTYNEVKKSRYEKPATLIFTGNVMKHDSGIYADVFTPKYSLEFFLNGKLFFVDTHLLFASVLSYYQMRYMALCEGRILNAEIESWPGYNEHSLKFHHPKQGAVRLV